MPPLLLVLVVCLALLQGCATSSPQPGPGGPGSGRSPLAIEQRRLADLFEGTPVVFAMQSDGSLRVTVPLRFAFDPGRFAVKPPLGAVLDRIATSQRTAPTRFMVAAPADAKDRGLQLANERAASARDYLVSRGLSATRFTVAPVAGDSVVIVVADPTAH